jgi:hypothetical protein
MSQSAYTNERPWQQQHVVVSPDDGTSEISMGAPSVLDDGGTRVARRTSLHEQE